MGKYELSPFHYDRDRSTALWTQNQQLTHCGSQNDNLNKVLTRKKTDKEMSWIVTKCSCTQYSNLYNVIKRGTKSKIIII